MSNLRRILLLSLIVLASSQAREARANEPSFWAVPDAQEQLYEKKMAEADRLALMAVHYETARSRRKGLADRALAAYEEAARASPTRAEPHYRAAYLSTEFQTKSPFARETELERAIAHFEKFEELAPLDARLPDALFQRSLLRTKRGRKRDIELGIEDYDKELALIDQVSESRRNSMSTILSNRAELSMMLGDLEEAIIGYQKAIEFEDGITYGYGLAVALDRDGQGYRAREVMRDYALRDSGNALLREGTFFVPDGEIFYYMALKAEALSDYRQAQMAYRAFLQNVPQSRYIARARQNLAAIASKAAAQPKPKRTFKKYQFRSPF
jgi:tetratricopeptide (TPR) repeat protein